jgi:hypothetical protein
MAVTSNQYQIYLNSVLALARYIVVKSTATADAINAYITNAQLGEVDLSDQTTWRYYMNLAGQYHPLDTPMYVVSMDTLETIEFTAANLAFHTATAKAYQFGQRDYVALVALYPTQITLINGILNPVDIEDAITADDGQILTYPSVYVEFNEYTFIEKLQRWIYGFKTRWVNLAYTISDNMYVPFTMGIMYALLPQVILSLRLEACKTNEAHSFHVRQYLLSHGLLDVYLDQLTTLQALELYRNINYLERNAGQSEIFDWLVDHIMTERNLPLAKYTMRHDVSQLPTETYPTIIFTRDPVNLGYNLDAINQISLDEMLEKEWPVARDNQKYQGDYEPTITQDMENSLSNELPTKALESSMIDYTGSVKYPLADTLVNNWLWLSSLGIYNAAVTFTNPATGENVPLFAKDAFCLSWYALNASIGITLDQIPPMLATRVPRIPIPAVTDMMAVCDMTVTDQTTLQEIHDLMPLVQSTYPFLSTQAFYALCQQIYVAANTQNDLVAYQERMETRGYVKNATNLLWSDNLCYVADPSDNYTSWFAARNLNVGAFTTDQWAALYDQLVAVATGQDLVTTSSVANIQAAMIGMMKQLSSYSIQFMSNINDSTIVPAEWATIRIGNNQNAEQFNEMEATDLGVRALDQHPHFSNDLQNQVTKYTPLHDQDVSMSNTVKLGLRNLIHEVSGNIQHNFFNAGRVRFFEPPHVCDVPNPQKVIPVPGICDWLGLPLTDQQQITDIWGNDFNPTLPDTVPLSSVITFSQLTGLVYVQPGGSVNLSAPTSTPKLTRRAAASQAKARRKQRR